MNILSLGALMGEGLERGFAAYPGYAVDQHALRPFRRWDYAIKPFSRQVSVQNPSKRKNWMKNLPDDRNIHHDAVAKVRGIDPAACPPITQ